MLKDIQNTIDYVNSSRCLSVITNSGFNRTQTQQVFRCSPLSSLSSFQPSLFNSFPTTIIDYCAILYLLQYLLKAL